MPRSAHKGALAAAVVLVGALVVPVVSSTPAQATQYPSWQDVQAAKGNEDTKRAEIGTVQQALHQAQTTAATKSQAALLASSAADQADAALADATRSADTLQQQADTAADTAEQAKDRAGQLAAGLYRDGSTGTIASRIAGASDPEQLLYQLGAMDQLSTTWSDVLDDASVAANTATSLHDQAVKAEAARARLAQVAEDRADAAESAERVANAAVASTQRHSDELYAQLASLEDTTAATERQYQLGQQVRAQIAAQQAAAAAAAAAGNGSSDSYPSTGGVVVDPGGAQAYARSALPAYGWGDDQFGCLVSLWTQESGWRANALNVSSGAYGIPQSLPADKMATAGADWRTNAATQVNWGLAYIKGAYGSPCAAWNHEMSHNPHWY